MSPPAQRTAHFASARPSGRLVIVGLLAYAATAAVMFAPWPGLVAAVEQACGATALDVRAGWTATEAHDLLAACGPAGRAAYERLQWADAVYPGVTAVALVLTSRWLWARLGRRGWLIAVPAALAGLLDYAENVIVWNLLLRWPGSPGALADAGGAVTTAKRWVASLAFVIALTLALAVAGRRRTTTSIE
jgi:hypothetical protein